MNSLFSQFGRYLCVVLLGIASLSASAERVDEIRIEGNIKTRTQIIQQEMQLINGDEITDELLDRSRQAIMDLGLFKSVEIVVGQIQGLTLVVVSVEEKKHDWYVLPRIDRNGDGDITLGLNWRESNLNGLNQTSRLTLTHKTFDDASKDEQLRASWKFIYPRIVNTQFSTFAYADITQVDIDEERKGRRGNYERQEFSVGFGMGRWFSPFGASKGLHAEVGLEYRQFDHDHLGGQSGFYDDANFVSLIAGISFRDVANHLYSKEGYAIGLRLQQARKAWGSDRPFFHQQFFYRYYLPLASREHTNFNIQLQLASGDHSLFGEPIYELSGSHTLRGYPRETLEGDAYFLVNTEYLTPLFGKKNVRGAVLFDFGNAYAQISDIKDLDFEYGIGLGLRWKFKQWVGTELRIDYAYGLGDEGASRLYVASEATF